MARPLRLPGLNVPLESAKVLRVALGEGFVTNVDIKEKYSRNMFYNALDRQDIEDGGVARRMIPTREITMVRIMNDITDKPSWHEKIFDTEICKKWRAELEAKPAMDVTTKMMDWVIAELRHRSKDFNPSGLLPALNSGVVKSDSAISESLRESLKSAVAKLEDVPEHKKDYHPHTNNQVLDLVHPSLFPLVYGRTRALKDGIIGLDDCLSKAGSGETLPVPAEEQLATVSRYGNTLGPYSTKFQWLPCDLAFKPANVPATSTSTPKMSSPPEVAITSYVNNLHPRNDKALYGILEEVISRAIPLWNMTLPLCKRGLSGSEYVRIEYTEVKIDPHPDNLPEEDQPTQLPDEDEETYWSRHDEWRSQQFKNNIVLPEPGSFVPPKEVDMNEDARKHLEDRETVDLRRDYETTGLQIIVKLANIHLTPDDPEYKGGSWHVEGQLNEHICATALYYYDSSNITESRLEFRQQCSEDDVYWLHYDQDQHEFLHSVFGCRQGQSTIQNLGSVLCKQGRLITFPNVLQHRVEPFRLADPTKPGHRKILALFLVDPNIRIISTANVPPQRADWWAESLPSGGNLDKLPPELFNEVISHVNGFPLSMEEAKELRLELMEERSADARDQNEMFCARDFSLCEH